jgi:hypothetical protein
MDKVVQEIVKPTEPDTALHERHIALVPGAVFHRNKAFVDMLLNRRDRM